MVMLHIKLKGMKHTITCLANILTLYTPLTPGLGSKGHFFVSESGHVAYQIKLNEVENTNRANILPFSTSMAPGWGQKVKTIFFSEEGHVAYQIKRMSKTLCK